MTNLAIANNQMKSMVAAKFKTPQAIAEMKKDIESCRIRVSKELKSSRPNREVVKIKVERISYLNHLMKYGYGVK